MTTHGLAGQAIGHGDMETNDVSTALEVGAPPNFLRDRVHEIGVTAVKPLEGRNFVVCCSITERNHITLLHVWKRLLARIK